MKWREEDEKKLISVAGLLTGKDFIGIKLASLGNFTEPQRSSSFPQVRECFSSELLGEGSMEFTYKASLMPIQSLQCGKISNCKLISTTIYKTGEEDIYW